MSDNRYSIQEVVGPELARHYPDSGFLVDSNLYNSILEVEWKRKSWWRRLAFLARDSQTFWALVSSSSKGLRITVSLDQFKIFIPWSQASVSAQRTPAATAVTLRTDAIPELTLILRMDDVAADDLLRGVIEPLPRRDPPRRLAWWLGESWLVWIALIAGVTLALVILRKA
jgi:hypothetical protein